MKAYLTAIVCFFGFSAASAETYRIAAWNIQDLHHQEGFALRSFGGRDSVRRDTEDFDLLASYVNRFGKDERPADVIALQEMGTKAALERLFPTFDYDLIMSPRWVDDNASDGEGDVYTAIAIRKDSGVTIIEESPLAELAILHTDGNPVRAGTGALLDFDGTQVWFLSVHLKSSCSNVRKAHTSKDDDCETLWRQIPILRSWMEDKQASGKPFIIAGDFNRRFREFDAEGPVWKALNGVTPDQGIVTPELVMHPIKTTRHCPSKSTSPEPIDWILLDAGIETSFVENSYWERRFDQDDVNAAKGGKGLSDHCPISIDITFLN